ncbi:MAG: Gfo/Idh/MocA family oxidoreductase [Myxococcota bacterium]
MTAPLRWAVIGVGTAGRARAHAIQADPRCVLVAVHRGRHANTLGVPTLSLEDAIAAADAVAVCSPSEAHPAQVAAVLAAGRHVVVEYPLAPDADTAARLFDTARAAANAGPRVLHEEHIELLGGAAVVLRASVRPAEVTAATVTFTSPTPAAASKAPGALARHNHARLHRLVDVAGPVAAVLAVTPSSEGAIARLDATLQLVSGARVHLDFRHGPGLPRSTTLTFHTPAATWRQVDAVITRDDVPVPVPDVGPLFALDHALAVARILDGAPPPVPEARLLHVLRVVDALAAARLGPLSPT